MWMKSKLWVIAAFLLAVMMISSMLFAIGESKFKYEGKAVYDDGTVVPDGTYAMRFQLWDIQHDGDVLSNLKWQETRVTTNAVDVVGGEYVVVLGELSPIPGGIFDNQLWLDVLIDTTNPWGGLYQPLGERKLVPSVPNAFTADHADRADYAQAAGNADALEGKAADEFAAVDHTHGEFWTRTGNSNIVGETDFLGTKDENPLHFRVNNQRALSIQPSPNAPNIIAGYKNNSASASAYAATVSGGGIQNNENKATENYATVSGGVGNVAGNNNGDTNDARMATVGGGYRNTASSSSATVAGGAYNVASANAATVPGGLFNTAAGEFSMAAGQKAKANHKGTFVWADSTNVDFASTANDQYLIQANGGVGINTNATAGHALKVNGKTGIDGELDVNDNKITNVAAPAAGSDAANKDYVDSAISGGSVSYATNAGHANTADNSTSANNAANLGGETPAFYQNADNINAGTLDAARLPAAVVMQGEGNAQLTNDAGYLTSYTEADTLADVTARGASTTDAITLEGGVNTDTISEATADNGVAVDGVHIVDGAAVLSDVGEPASFTNKLYNRNGDLYWNGSAIASGGSSNAGTHFTSDVTVDGSLGVGYDIVDGESFGFDTFRLKENNLRIHFDDTSTSSSFPANDWRLTANDSANGGDNYFSIDDATAGRQLLRVDAGAPANSIYVADDGGVGFGTKNTLNKGITIARGDTPAIRFDQDGTIGWAPYKWDIAANETNFFIRDVNNGSALPFRIKPGSPTDNLTLNNGQVGIGTWSPQTDVDLTLGSQGGVAIKESTTPPADAAGFGKLYNSGGDLYWGSAQVDTESTLADVTARGASTTDAVTLSGGVSTDTISEVTADNGVIADEVVLRNGQVGLKNLGTVGSPVGYLATSDGELYWNGTALGGKVFENDLIVRNSIGVGYDIENDEVFDFDTIRMKENNVRLHFEDTSTTASFPSNDWRIVANDSFNGGGNYLAFEDASAEIQPFKVMAGAQAGTLIVAEDSSAGADFRGLHIGDGGQMVRDQVSETAGGALELMNGVWQSFTAGASANLLRIDFQVMSFPVSAYDIAIYEGEGTSGALLDSATGLAEASYTLGTPIALTEGSTYTFAFTDVASNYLIRNNGSADPTNPEDYVGGTSSLGDYDIVFSTYMDFSDPKVKITSAGVGIDNASPAEALDVNGVVKLGQVSAPGTTTDRLYNAGGNLYWNGTQLDTAGGTPNLQAVTDQGATTTNSITVAGIQSEGNITLKESGAVASALGKSNSVVPIDTYGNLYAGSDKKIYYSNSDSTVYDLTDTGGDFESDGSVAMTGALNMNSNAVSAAASVELPAAAAPATTTNKLYNNTGTLSWNGMEVETKIPLPPVGPGKADIYWGSQSVSTGPGMYTLTIPDMPVPPGRMVVMFIAAAPNIGSDGIDINGYGAVPLFTKEGAMLVAGNIAPGQLVTIVWDDTLMTFRCTNVSVNDNVIAVP